MIQLSVFHLLRSQSGGAVAVITWSLIMPQHYARARVFYSMIASRIALKGNFSIIYVHSIFTFFTLRLKFLLSIFITTLILSLNLQSNLIKNNTTS